MSDVINMTILSLGYGVFQDSSETMTVKTVFILLWGGIPSIDFITYLKI